MSFLLPHTVAFSAFMICNDFCAFVVMLAMCVLYVSLEPSVTHNTCVCVCVYGECCVFSICICSLVLDSVMSGVKGVQIVLSGLSMRLLSFVHCVIVLGMFWMRFSGVYKCYDNVICL